jgi:hypothetical protein
MTMRLRLSVLASVLLGGSLAGCGATGEVKTDCEVAAELMETCFGGLAQQTACDEQEAAQVVGLSCEQLTVLMKDTKSDLGRALADAGCEWGFYRFCVVPECDPEADEPVSALPPHGLESPSDCAEDALRYEGCGACEYYACREAEAQCGVDGYLLSYAYRYCNKFRLITEPKVSHEGQMWLRKIRRCLITTMDVGEPDIDCSSIDSEGYDSHTQCYIDTGFCALPLSDRAAVLATIDILDFSFRESFIIGHKCIEDWVNGGGP